MWLSQVSSFLLVQSQQRISLSWFIIVFLLSSIYFGPSLSLLWTIQSLSLSFHTFCFSFSAVPAASPSFLWDAEETVCNFPLAYVKCLCKKQEQLQSVTCNSLLSWFPTATLLGQEDQLVVTFITKEKVNCYVRKVHISPSNNVLIFCTFVMSHVMTL